MYVHYELNGTNPYLDLLVQVTTKYVLKDLGLDNVVGSIVISTVDHIPTPDDMGYVYGEATIIDGIYDISIKSSLTVKQVINVVAHELRHIWQFTRGWDMDNTLPYFERPQEIDAHNYNVDFYNRVGSEIYTEYQAKKLVAV